MLWFAPCLMPLRQISGLPCNTLSTASFTQSTGVPVHDQVSTLSIALILCKRKGCPMVMAWPIPDWGLSGATTTIFPRSFTASTRFRRRVAVTPSSLVIRMTGFSLVELTAAPLVLFVLLFRGFVFPIGDEEASFFLAI